MNKQKIKCEYKAIKGLWQGFLRRSWQKKKSWERKNLLFSSKRIAKASALCYNNNVF